MTGHALSVNLGSLDNSAARAHAVQKTRAMMAEMALGDVFHLTKAQLITVRVAVHLKMKAIVSDSAVSVNQLRK